MLIINIVSHGVWVYLWGMARVQTIPTQDYAKAKWVIGKLMAGEKFLTRLMDEDEFARYLRLLGAELNPKRLYHIKKVSYLDDKKVQVWRVH